MDITNIKITYCDIRDVTAGDSVRVILPANIYVCVLHDDVFIGPFVERMCDWAKLPGAVTRVHF